MIELFYYNHKSLNVIHIDITFKEGAFFYQCLSLLVNSSIPIIILGTVKSVHANSQASKDTTL